MFEYTSINQYQLALAQDKISCTETVRYYLSQIEKNKHLNAFIHVFGDEALKKAAGGSA